MRSAELNSEERIKNSDLEAALEQFREFVTDVGSGKNNG